MFPHRKNLNIPGVWSPCTIDSVLEYLVYSKQRCVLTPFFLPSTEPSLLLPTLSSMFLSPFHPESLQTTIFPNSFLLTFHRAFPSPAHPVLYVLPSNPESLVASESFPGPPMGSDDQLGQGVADVLLTLFSDAREIFSIAKSMVLKLWGGAILI